MNDRYSYKWKNRFFKMKGDVGMALIMKKYTNKKDASAENKNHTSIPTSFFL